MIGTTAFALYKNPTKRKFDARAKEGVLVEYSEVSKGYRVWMPSESRVVTARDVKFKLELKSATAEKDVVFENFVDDDVVRGVRTAEPTQSEVREFETATRSCSSGDVDEGSESTVIRRAPGRPRLVCTESCGRPRKEYRTVSVSSTGSLRTPRSSVERVAQDEDAPGDLEQDVAEDDVSHEANRASVFATEVRLREVMDGPRANEWRDAMVAEFRSIFARDTWELVDRPAGRAVIGCRPVLTYKLKPDGTLSRRKVRLVARGFSQRPGVDFVETFAPVARLGSL